MMMKTKLQSRACWRRKKISQSPMFYSLSNLGQSFLVLQIKHWRLPIGQMEWHFSIGTRSWRAFSQNGIIAKFARSTFSSLWNLSVGLLAWKTTRKAIWKKMCTVWRNQSCKVLPKTRPFSAQSMESWWRNDSNSLYRKTGKFLQT